jgi:dihydrofolate reductase
MLIRAHFAVSLDGFSATEAGLPAFFDIPGFRASKQHGHPEFVAECSAVVMGRTTFDPAVDNAWWPWPGLDVHVLTSQPMPDKEFETPVHGYATVEELVTGVRAQNYAKDVQFLGGPRTFNALLDAGAIDRLELLVLPLLLGSGLPLATGATASRLLTLVDQKTFDDGCVELHYELKAD